MTRSNLAISPSIVQRLVVLLLNRAAIVLLWKLESINVEGRGMQVTAMFALPPARAVLCEVTRSVTCKAHILLS